MSDIERVPGSTSLIEIARPDQEYIVAREITIEHMVGRSEIGRLNLMPGDVVRVIASDPQRGLSLKSSRYPQGLVLVSPATAALIYVEHI